MSIKALVARILLYGVLAASIFAFYRVMTRFDWNGYTYHARREFIDLYTNCDSATSEGYLELCLGFKRAFDDGFFPVTPDKPLKVYLFGDNRSYYWFCHRASYTPSQYGFFLRRQRLIIVKIDSGLGTLLHEVAHYFLSTTGKKYPAWFEEGFCAYFEKFLAVRDPRTGAVGEFRFGFFSPWRFEEELELKAAGRLSLDSLLVRRPVIQSEARSFILYCQRQGKLSELLRLVHTDRHGRQIIEEALGSDLVTVQREWLAWIDRSGVSGEWQGLPSSAVLPPGGSGLP